MLENAFPVMTAMDENITELFLRASKRTLNVTCSIFYTEDLI